MYRPCFFKEWCNATKGFDCAQPERTYTIMEAKSGPNYLHVTGFRNRPKRCDSFEVTRRRLDAVPVQHSHEQNDGVHALLHGRPTLERDRLALESPDRPHDRGQGSSEALEPQLPTGRWRSSSCTTSRRASMCANHGNCTAPDVCRCEEGWGRLRLSDARSARRATTFEAKETFVSGTENDGTPELRHWAPIRTCRPLQRLAL